MAEHEPCTGGSDDWYTPPDFFARWSVVFDLDPCSPGAGHWVPARRIYTIADDGLRQKWSGFVFMNPPFGARFGHVPWIEKFIAHGNGVGIVRAYTSSSWWHELMPRVDSVLFPRGKTRFVPSEANRARLEQQSKTGKFSNAPGHGVAVFACGKRGREVLALDAAAGNGMLWPIHAAY